MKTKTTFEPFNKDVAANGGYVYTTNGRFSSYIANLRQTQAILDIAEFKGKKVIDIGCGDGTYTVELFDKAQTASIVGIDPAEEAIKLAQEKIMERTVSFEVASAYSLPFASDSFDIAHMRGVLHHMDKPIEALREALRVASIVVVLEPNGYNPVLKLIEKTSRYHIEHGEKSYAPYNLKRWVTTEMSGRITHSEWIGLVPYFCPDWMAHSLKVVEPLVERIPVINAIGCGNYVFLATRA
jgi:ubiquinone/menaquinone biosynthesis C-methylase UbiE